MTIKQLFAITIFILAIDIKGGSDITILNYNNSHKDAVLKLAFEDVLKFFCGSEVVTRGIMTEEEFTQENKKGMEAILNNPHSVTRVLLNENKLVGFVEFNKTREQSIEAILKMITAQGLPTCTEEQLAATIPQLKKTDAECKDYALIECLAISRDCRGKGFGKMLLKDALDKIKKSWPSLDQVRLTVNESNTVARKLYESHGFIPNPNQLPHLTMMKIIEYQKSL